MTENRQGYLKVYIMHRQNPSGFYIHPMQLRDRSSATFIEKKKVYALKKMNQVISGSRIPHTKEERMCKTLNEGIKSKSTE